MVVATGFFDGVHLGHRLVIDRLVSAAHERGTESLVVTFWPHPRTVLQNGARDLRLLTSLREKKDMLYAMGVDRVEVLNFTKPFSRLSTAEYLKQYLIDRFGADAILLGYDNRIGFNAGTTDEIAAEAEALGLEVIRTDFIEVSGLTVSSTKIREALAHGKLDMAASMLGYDYSLEGVVVSGNRIGRTIGFPTANMQLYEPLKLVPGNGVYLVRVSVLGKFFHGMCNIGVRPTIGRDSKPIIETNIFDFDEEIYGLDINLTFLEKIRDERRFSSLDDLRCQLSLDRDYCKSKL